MRSEGLSCKNVSIYLMTNPFAEGEQYQNHITATLPHLSAYLPEIQSTANDLLRKIYRPNYKYRKVMIGLTGLAFDENPQLDLFNTAYNRGKELEPLMQAFDKINNRYGRGTIMLGSGVRKKSNEQLAMSKESWKSKHEYLSPCYTTNIRDIPKAY